MSTLPRIWCAVAVAALLPAALSGQGVFRSDTPKEPGARTWLARKAALPPFRAPRTPDGAPNLQGNWGAGYSGDVIEETEYVETARRLRSRAGYRIRPTAGFPTSRGRSPLAMRTAQGSREDGLANGQRLYADPQTFCLENVPRYSERGFELVQTRNYVTILLGWGHLYRVIPLDGRPRPSEAFKSWMGVSRGRWDGDTLVVDVTNINGKMWLDSVGNFYGENAHLTERFRLADANTLDYEVTFDDPTMFTRPWKANFPLPRVRESQDPYSAELWEQACHEGNEHHINGIKSLGFKWYCGEKQ